MATGTQIEVVMPQMGVSVSEGTITKWLKQPGEAIAQDEPLLEISTDKVDTEVPSPGEGLLAEILVAEGETVEVGTVLAVITPAGAAGAEPVVGVEPAAPETDLAEPPAAAPAPPAPVVSGAEPQAAPAVPSSAPTQGNGRTFVSPVVARIAAEHGVDPNVVAGTGTGGRVTKKDIIAYIESGAHTAAAAEPAPVEATVPVTPATPAAPAAQPVAAAPAPPPHRRSPPRPPRRRRRRSRWARSRSR